MLVVLTVLTIFDLPRVVFAAPSETRLLVSGRVTRADGTPWGGLPITVSRQPSSCAGERTGGSQPQAGDRAAIEETSTDEDGFFATRVGEPQVVGIHAGPAQGLAARDSVVPVARSVDVGSLGSERNDGSSRPTRTAPGEVADLRLLVTDAASELPIAGALVWVEEEPACWGRTGPAGTLLLRGPAAGWIQVAAAGHLDGLVAAGRSPLSVALEPAPASLTGQVYGAGRVLANALVELVAPPRALRTEPDGSFTMKDLPRRAAFELHVTAKGFSPGIQRVHDPAKPVRVDLQRP